MKHLLHYPALMTFLNCPCPCARSAHAEEEALCSAFQMRSSNVRNEIRFDG